MADGDKTIVDKTSVDKTSEWSPVESGYVSDCSLKVHFSC